MRVDAFELETLHEGHEAAHVSKSISGHIEGCQLAQAKQAWQSSVRRFVQLAPRSANGDGAR